MANKDIWDSLKQPPPSALREIQGGRLKGKTDISPQWRYEAMTEHFGPCGVGWKYEIIQLWSEPASDEQVFANAEIVLFFKDGDKWSEPIPGIGGSLLVNSEASGLHANDEAYKMAVTDALSVALKMLGVAADVYAGLWDGTKYKTQGETPEAQTPSTGPEHITEPQKKKIYAASREKELSGTAIGAYIAGVFGKSHTKDLLKAEATQLIEAIEGGKITVETR